MQVVGSRPSVVALQVSAMQELLLGLPCVMFLCMLLYLLVSYPGIQDVGHAGRLGRGRARPLSSWRASLQRGWAEADTLLPTFRCPSLTFHQYQVASLAFLQNKFCCPL